MRSLLPRFIIALATVTVLGSATAQAANRYVNPDGLCGGNLPCHTTLAAAHTAAVAGDMIIVQPAVYNFAAILDVTKSVSFIGPQANINAVPLTGSTRVAGSANEAILVAGAGVSGIFRVRVSNVEINGFEMVGSTLDQVSTLATTPITNLTVSNNIMHGAADDGLQLRNIASSFVECNYIYEMGGDGVNICCQSQNVTVRNNELHNTNSPDAAISILGSSNTVTEGNIVFSIPNGSGIQIGSPTGTDIGLLNNVVVANVVRDVADNGIALLTSNSAVRCNEVASVAGTAAIYSEFGVANNALTENNVHNNTLLVAGPSGIQGAFYFGAAVLTPTFTVTNNIIDNNVPFGMVNHAPGAVNAAGNYWGDPTGPSGAGPGSGDAVGPNIAFLPFLPTAPTLNCQSSTECADFPTPTRQDATWGKLKGMYR